ncbi:MAG: 5-hydroxyisourate hydrolase [Saprospiraceae bacterium]|jgi:5-hydroxyisourate hydrolase
MGFLTTHVLDTAQGIPAAGIPISLYRLGNDRLLVRRLITNSDGRTDEPILPEAEFALGTWELVFEVKNYFENSTLITDDPAFLDDISLRFSMSNDDHYHVPLLVSPWSYSTYRGS